jgi:3-oxoacyl-[acyl-carrier protein] reductase
VLAEGDSFRGRVALVTGAASGLGRAVALRLAEEGAAVAVNYARSEQEARAVVEQIEAAGGRALAVRADVSEPDAVGRMVREVEASLGSVELLVANAGTTRYVPFPEIDRLPASLWEEILGVNLVGAFLCVQAVAPAMRARGSGSVVLVSSNSALGVEGSSIPYVVSKAGLLTLTRCLASALAPAIRVNAVAPGWMLTPWIDKHIPTEVAETLRESARTTTRVEDVVDAILHLLANRSLTGSALVVDGGELVVR